MIFTQSKPIDEILEALGKEKNIFLLACNGCAEACETGGEKGLSAMKTELEKAGKKITGVCLVDFLCNKVLVTTRLSREMDKIQPADSIVVLTCGIGVQAVSTVVDKVVHPADNTVSLGGLQGLWPSDERCQACGDCALDYTGGICPVAFCAKSLLNGPCGGARDRKCEVDPEKDCGWQLIYERLEKIGRLENFKKIRMPRDHSKMMPSEQLRKTSFYDIEL
ncbi:MAG: methylenetetrahydrofolate reductase C-terminal domain-containing protein [Sedimentisphaerales bacterium]|jgi:ferredoxin|nr:methylenetetrahydrofolate reductase C-terminal domain-containing protein [Sedimentisphaerales bacterium]